MADVDEKFLAYAKTLTAGLNPKEHQYINPLFALAEIGYMDNAKLINTIGVAHIVEKNFGIGIQCFREGIKEGGMSENGIEAAFRLADICVNTPHGKPEDLQLIRTTLSQYVAAEGITPSAFSASMALHLLDEKYPQRPTHSPLKNNDDDSGTLTPA